MLGLVALLLVAPGVAQAQPAPGVVTQTLLDDRDFTRMHRGGVETLRFLIRWREVEPEPGRLDWSAIDHVVASAARHRIELLPIVYGSPTWVAQSELHPPIDDAADRAAWRGFLTALVDRYGPRGDFWEGAERARADHPLADLERAQLRLLLGPEAGRRRVRTPARDLRRAIRAADRRAEIMLAGVAAVRSGMPWVAIPARAVRAAGVKRHFDFVALHPYAPGLRLMRRQIELARRIMATADDSRTPLAITEVGWASEGPASTMVKGLRGQARLLKRTYRLLGGGHPDWRISDVEWYAWRDSMTVEAYCSFCQHAGLFDLAGEPSPPGAATSQPVPRDGALAPTRG